jgi:hypothetical protein
MMRRLIDNAGWKLLALFAAFALWAGFVAESELATSLPAPLRFRNLPRDLEIVSDAGFDRIYLKVRGPSTQISAESLANAAIVLDMSSVDRPGERTFTLNSSNVELPPGVHLVRVVPSQVRLQFERRLIREVPIEARFSSPPQHGYSLVFTRVKPERVRVAGPESRVRSIARAQTDPIDLGATVSDAEFRVPIALPDPHVRLEDTAAAQVSVQVKKTR